MCLSQADDDVTERHGGRPERGPTAPITAQHKLVCSKNEVLFPPAVQVHTETCNGDPVSDAPLKVKDFIGSKKVSEEVST